MMTFDDMNDAINEAEVTIARGNWMVSRMIAMCAGRLRKAGIPASRLSALKRELRGWDMHRKEWKD